MTVLGSSGWLLHLKSGCAQICRARATRIVNVAKHSGQAQEPSAARSMTMRVSSTREAMLSLRKAWRR